MREKAWEGPTRFVHESVSEVGSTSPGPRQLEQWKQVNKYKTVSFVVSALETKNVVIVLCAI